MLLLFLVGVACATRDLFLVRYLAAMDPAPCTIITVVGARPQFVKAAMVSRALAACNSQGRPVREVLLHTGQHYDHGMSEVFFQELELPRPTWNLGVRESLHGAMTARMLEGIEQKLLECRPDMLLVYGDTTSTLAGALAASKLHVPVAHVEAGVRSFNRRMPEELNRVLTDAVSSLLFCPTETAAANLAREGVNETPTTSGRPPLVRVVGDVMYDAVLHYAVKAKGRARQELPELPQTYGVVTLHRAENTDDPETLRRIFQGLECCAEKLPLIWPMHPRTRERLQRQGLVPSQCLTVAPLGYLAMLDLLQGAEVVFTDSGGLQKEALFLSRQCITLREETEWPETVAAGGNQLAGSDPERMARAFTCALEHSGSLECRGFGAGDAAHRIAQAMVSWLGQDG